MLNVEIKTVPSTRFLKFIKIPFLYVFGSYFTLRITVKNLGKTQFAGGKIRIIVEFAAGKLPIFIEAKIGQIAAGQTVVVNNGKATKLGVLAQGHALFWATIINTNGQEEPIGDKNGNLLAKQPTGYHIHTFHALTVGELYSLLALSITTTVFIVNTCLTVIINQQKIFDFKDAFIQNIPLSVTIMSFISVLIIAYVAFAIKPES